MRTSRGEPLRLTQAGGRHRRHPTMVGSGRSLERLRAVSRRHGCVREVRGLGLLLAVEFRDDPASGMKADALAQSVLYRCLEKGLSPSVTEHSTLRLSPPLVISDEDMARALDWVEEAIQEAVSGK